MGLAKAMLSRTTATTATTMVNTTYIFLMGCSSTLQHQAPPSATQIPQTLNCWPDIVSPRSDNLAERLPALSAMSNTLTPGSAFWALIPIALAAMTQPSGMILGTPSDFDFVLRSSPLVCALSVIDTVCRLIVYSIVERSPSKGLRRFMLVRFKDEREGSNVRSAGIRQNFKFRAILFVFGVIPQAVKIYTCTGIPDVHQWTTCYLASLATDEIIMLLSPAYTTIAPVPDLRVPVFAPATFDGYDFYKVYTSTVLSYSIIMTFLMLSDIIAVLFGFPSMNHRRRVTPASVYGCTIAPLSLFQIALTWSGPHATIEMFWKNGGTIPAVLYLLHSQLPLFVYLTAAQTAAHWAQATSTAFALYPIVLLAIKYPSGDFHPWCQRLARPHIRRILIWSFAAFFALTELLATGAFCFWSYDPSRTSKPAWTDWLG